MGELGTAYRERVSALAARLDAADAAQQRDALRGELIALGKGLEQDLAELTLLKDEAKTLVEKWKSLRMSTAPTFSAERPVVADHIGASTFIEKGLATTPARRTRSRRPCSSRPTIRRRNRCSAGRRCSRRSTTTR